MVFDGIDTAFHASDNASIDEARWEILNTSWDDDALSRIAFSAEYRGHGAWLRRAIHQLIGDKVLWKRAKGLTLASFANLNVEEFDELVARAQAAGTWIDVENLRDAVRTNTYAQYWYGTFISANTEDGAWGALQMVLACADLRFHLWRNQYERDDARTLRRHECWARLPECR